MLLTVLSLPPQDPTPLELHALSLPRGRRVFGYAPTLVWIRVGSQLKYGLDLIIGYFGCFWLFINHDYLIVIIWS